MTIDANGPWKVTTEGDEEGRTTRNLGAYSGPIDRVALALADKANYKLTIEPLVIVDAATLPVVAESVHISVYGSGIDLPRLLAGRPVSVRQSNLYESYEIVAGHGYDAERKRSFARIARSKLSADELAALADELRG